MYQSCRDSLAHHQVVQDHNRTSAPWFHWFGATHFFEPITSCSCNQGPGLPPDCRTTTQTSVRYSRLIRVAFLQFQCSDSCIKEQLFDCRATTQNTQNIPRGSQGLLLFWGHSFFHWGIQGEGGWILWFNSWAHSKEHCACHSLVVGCFGA